MPPFAEPPAQVQAAPAAIFAPREEQPYRLRVEQRRDDGTGARRYSVDRLLRFRRDPAGGWIAELTTVALDGGGTAAGERFVRGLRGLLGRTLRFHLSPNGDVRTLEDQAGAWAALLDGLVHQGDGNAEQAATAERLAAPMRALGADAQRAMLASMLLPAIGVPDLAGGVRPERAISETGRPPFADGAVLAGRERAWIEGDALIAERSVAGTARPQTAGAAAVQVARGSRRRVDRRTGLLLDARETSRTTLGGVALDTQTVTTLAPVR